MLQTEMMWGRKETKPVALTIGLTRDISQLLENSKLKFIETCWKVYGATLGTDDEGLGFNLGFKAFHLSLTVLGI